MIAIKRLWTLFTVAMLLLSGCTVIAPRTPPHSVAPSDDADPLPITPARYTPYYDALSDDLQPYYRKIVAALRQQSGCDTQTDGEPSLTVLIDPPLANEADVTRLCDAVYNDHPELFYLTDRSAYILENGRCIAITLYYSMSLAERTTAADEMNAVVEQLSAECRELSAFEAELWLHDALLARCRYHEEAANTTGDDKLHIECSSPFAALCKGYAICGGYTRAMQLLLDRVGIQSAAVYGGDHVWNMVWIDGEAYHLDATWNDGTHPTHHYFNVTEEEIARSRRIDAQSFALPTATATTANYHIRKGLYYNGSVTDDAFAALFLQQIAAADHAEIRFSQDTVDDALKAIADGQFHRILERLKTVENGDEIYHRWYRFYYIVAEETGAVTFFIEDDKL